MTIAVIGSGYVGTTAAAIFANCGHQVTALDVDQTKVDTINDGQAPFYEAGLQQLISAAVGAGSLSATTAYEQAITDADIVFSCVGTPDNPDGSSDLSYVLAAAEEAVKHLEDDVIYVQKSTVPVGTGRRVIELLPDSAAYVSNPEFLRESTAIADTLLFDRIVAGGDREQAVQRVLDLHKSVEDCAADIGNLAELNIDITTNSGQYIATQLESAELIKVSANAFLAMKISFANSIAKLCDQAGADITEVMAAVGADQRIGSAFLNAGRGYGGGCFPKDVSGLISSAIEHETELPIMTAVQDVNQSMPGYIIHKVQQQLGSLSGRSVLVLGLAFKPGTSDARKSPAVAIANQLDHLGAEVTAYDPQASEEAAPDLRGEVKLIDEESTLSASDVVFVATNWPKFDDVVTSLKDTVVVDCMNAYSPDQLPDSVDYIGVGRGRPASS